MQTHLFRRGAVYHVRRRLPLPIAKSTGRTHVVRSLRTSDPQIARRSVRLVNTLLDDWFTHMTETGRRPTADDLHKVLTRVFRTLLDRDEIERASRPAVDPDDAELELYDVVWVNDGSDPDAPDEIHELKTVIAASHEIDVWKDRLSRNETAAIAADVDAAIVAEGMTLDSTSAEYRVLLHRSMRAAVRAAEIALDRENGKFQEDSFDPRAITTEIMADPVPAKPVASSAPPAPMLSEEWAHFVAVKTASDWKGDNCHDADVAWRLWMNLIGDIRIDKLKDEPLEFRNLLEKIPTLNGRSVFSGLTPREAIARADALHAGQYTPDEKKNYAVKAGEPVARLTKKTMNKHLGFFNTLFETKRVQRIVPENPFLPILWAKKAITEQAKKSGSGRTNFTADSLLKLFSSPLWSGMKSAGRKTEPGTVIDKSDPLFWLPLISLFSGMRLEEATQLWCEDIIEKDGVWWFNITKGPGRDLKTDASERAIPMHRELVKIGLPDYVQERQKAGDLRLFPDLIVPSENGMPQSGFANSDAASKRFGYYRRKVGIGGKWEDFHATRHTFITEGHNAGLADRLIAFLVGHEGGAIELNNTRKMTNRVYHGGYRPEVLVDAINRIKHEGLDLSKLYTKASQTKADEPT